MQKSTRYSLEVSLENRLELPRIPYCTQYDLPNHPADTRTLRTRPMAQNGKARITSRGNLCGVSL